MNGIKLRISKPKDKLSAGSSKLFGNPDVWDGFEWPYIEENGELSDLYEMILTDEEGNSLAFSEQKIDFEASDADKKSAHLLLEDMTQSCDFINNRLPLLRICSLETEDAEIRFQDNGALCFYIEKEKLGACDFSEVKAAQI